MAPLAALPHDAVGAVLGLLPGPDRRALRGAARCFYGVAPPDGTVVAVLLDSPVAAARLAVAGDAGWWGAGAGRLRLHLAGRRHGRVRVALCHLARLCPGATEIGFTGATPSVALVARAVGLFPALGAVSQQHPGQTPWAPVSQSAHLRARLPMPVTVPVAQTGRFPPGALGRVRGLVVQAGTRDAARLTALAAQPLLHLSLGLSPAALPPAMPRVARLTLLSAGGAADVVAAAAALRCDDLELVPVAHVRVARLPPLANRLTAVHNAVLVDADDAAALGRLTRLHTLFVVALPDGPLPPGDGPASPSLRHLRVAAGASTAAVRWLLRGLPGLETLDVPATADGALFDLLPEKTIRRVRFAFGDGAVPADSPPGLRQACWARDEPGLREVWCSPGGPLVVGPDHYCPVQVVTLATAPGHLERLLELRRTPEGRRACARITVLCICFGGTPLDAGLARTVLGLLACLPAVDTVALEFAPDLPELHALALAVCDAVGTRLRALAFCGTNLCPRAVADALAERAPWAAGVC